MRLLVDANVLVAAMVEEDGGGEATALLKQEHEFCVSVTTLMEVRTVLSKKKRIEKEAIERTIGGIVARTDVYALERDDILNGYTMQKQNFLYPIDCLLLSLADDIGANLVTFGAELQDAGAVAPAELV
ncbi:type II toxin-antitoxin system VapC family toxin [Natronomonas sp. EA1]|uniref:type II toxin-antitoxin system VapC family toxin n=1 Tax=Natronomonas sp. EA1 TaxID=3421655 RepID=UPI003EB74AB7